MTFLRNSAMSIAVAAAAFGVYAQTDAEHAQHHPVEVAQKAPKAGASQSRSMAKESMAAMDSKIKFMREMHEKMMATKTPEERMALMDEHMKAMQEGMAMMDAKGSMGGMGAMMGMGSDAKKGGMPMDMASRQEMLEKRMEMMGTMMQMMMDRLPAPTAP